MMRKGFSLTAVALALGLAANYAHAGDAHAAPASGGPVCENAGPQTPRDIDSKTGENKVVFEVAPPYKDLNLCNLHFHNQAEHKAKDFSVSAGDGAHGHGGGFMCGMSKSLTAAEMKAPAGDICKGLKPGDTIEVHWVHTSCDIKPGKGLGSCVTDTCKDPKLRVEAQVYTLVNDPKATNFNDVAYGGNMVNGHHQAKAIPTNTGKPIQFLGSTTGPKYTEQACSDYKVTWSVRPQCAKVDINTVGEWCKKNEFEEDHAHGVRKLVTHQKLLGPIAN